MSNWIILILFRPLFKVFPKTQFVGALLVASGAELIQQWRLLREALKTKPVIPSDLVARRLSVCMACPVFFDALKTCGSALPGGHRDPEGNMMGCGCHMPTAASVEHNCWSYDHNENPFYGWPRELNSFPHDEHGK